MHLETLHYNSRYSVLHIVYIAHDALHILNTLQYNSSKRANYNVAALFSSLPLTNSGIEMSRAQEVLCICLKTPENLNFGQLGHLFSGRQNKVLRV